MFSDIQRYFSSQHRSSSLPSPYVSSSLICPINQVPLLLDPSTRKPAAVSNSRLSSPIPSRNTFQSTKHSLTSSHSLSTFAFLLRERPVTSSILSQRYIPFPLFHQHASLLKSPGWYRSSRLCNRKGRSTGRRCHLAVSTSFAKCAISFSFSDRLMHLCYSSSSSNRYHALLAMYVPPNLNSFSVTD